MGAEGLESPEKQPEDNEFSKSGASSGAISPLPPELSKLVSAWPNLPDRIKQAILAMIGQAT